MVTVKETAQDDGPHTVLTDDALMETLTKISSRRPPALLWTTDHELRLAPGHGAGIARAGSDRGLPVGRTLYEVFGTNDPDCAPIAAHLGALNGDPRHCALAVTDARIELRVEPIRDDNGKIVGCTAVLVGRAAYPPLASASRVAEQPAATTVPRLEVLLLPVERRHKVGGRRQADAQVRRELAHAHAQRARAAALEAERKRIARELHDGIGQSLSTIKFRIENAVALIRRGGPEAGIEMLDATVLQIREALEEVRRIARDLRPSLLDELGLVQAVAWLCRELEATHPATRVEKVMGLNEAIVPKALGAVIFRVLQEALTNIAKHARADRVLVRLNGSGDGIELVVQDNGQGFDPAHQVAGGCGLASMRERTELSGGRFSVQSGLGAGTVVRCQWGRGAAAVTA